MQYSNTIKGIGVVLTVGAVAALLACDDDSSGENGNEEEFHGSVLFEDSFDGTSLNEADWLLPEDSSAPYSLTEHGELQIEWETEDAGEDPTFIYKPSISNANIRISIAFRTTQVDPYEDDVDMALLIHGEIESDNGYWLVLTSDPIDGIRDYALSIYKIAGENFTELVTEYIGGSTPQIQCQTNYVLTGIYSNGKITFAIKSDENNLNNSVSISDSTYDAGKVGFNPDLNIGTSGPQSIFIDYFKVEVSE